jgi:hypothetical protein
MVEIRKKSKKGKTDFVGFSETRPTTFAKLDHSFDLWILNENSNSL